MSLFSFGLFASVDNIRFTEVENSDQLSQQTVMSIFQDSQGYIWFGTQEGLNRYDGIDFITYQPNYYDVHSLSNGWIYSISEGPDGSLWVGTNDGVNVLDTKTNKFAIFTAGETGGSINDKVARVVYRDRSDTMWVATRKGLNRYIPSENRFKHHNFIAGNGNQSVDVFAIAEDITGALWLGTSNLGLIRFDPYTEQTTIITKPFFTEDGEKRIGIRSLYIDQDQVLWIGTNGYGFYKLDLQTPKTGTLEDAIVMVEKLPGKNIMTIIKDSQQTLWLGTNIGLLYKDESAGTFSELTSTSGTNTELTVAEIWTLFSDNSGILWVGTFNGLNKWNTRTTQFDHFYYSENENNSLSSNNLTVITSANENKIYIGSHGGVDILDPNTGLIETMPIKTETQDGLREERVMSMAYVNETEIWFGYRARGASKFNPLTNKFVHYDSIRGDDTTLGMPGVTSILAARDGTIWFGTFNGGVSRYNRETDDFTTFKHDPNDISTLSSNVILNIYEASDNSLWIATWDAGLNIFVPKTGTAFRIKSDADDDSSIGSNRILTTIEDKDGNMWIGTHGGGLNILSKENKDRGKIVFDKIAAENGMPSNVAYGLVEDNENYIWASTNKGLVKVDRATNKTTVYKESQGIQGDEFNSGAYHKDNKGYLYFGGINGLTRFDPSEIQANPIAPKIGLTSFQRLNKIESVDQVLNQDGQIEINYTDYLIGFTFAALEFSSPQENQYRYMLEGFDKDWIEVRGARSATYTNLPSGTYRFRVIASNSDGIWNQTGKSVTLIVHPAPWFSPLAYSLYSIFIVVVLWFVYRHFEKKSHAQEVYKIQLEEEVSKRTQELQDANEQLFQASITDQLTGLHNRRYLSDVINQRIDDMNKRFSQHILDEQVDASTGPRLMALMFDLDGFKPVNDNYGHDAGDQVIIQVANILRNECHTNDIVIRWGGDEYMVITEVAQLEDAHRFAERIRIAISSHAFDVGLPNKFNLSSSLGFALYPFNHFAPHSISWDQVHLLADQALYKSKESGRNTWSGIVQSDNELPFKTLNTLVPNLEQAIEEKNVILLQRGKQHAIESQRIDASPTKEV